MNEENLEKTYVYKGKEVVMTGRQATRKGRRSSNIVKVIYEVRPIDIDEENKSYNEWVTKEELYEIQQ